MSLPFDNIAVQRTGAVATITIQRPERLNALNRATLAELDRALDELAAGEGLRVLIFTGAGEKAFVAGADIRELASLSPLEALAFAERGQRLMQRIATWPQPVIAAINGYALGGGLELALACTFRLASSNAKLGLPEVKLGLLPGYGGTQRLARLVGAARALELMLTGEPLSATEAERVGLVQRVVPPADLPGEAQSWAHRLAAQAPVAVALILRAVREGLQMNLEQGLQLEASLFATAASSDDMKEGTRAFLEKRPPHFSGH